MTPEELVAFLADKIACHRYSGGGCVGCTWKGDRSAHAAHQAQVLVDRLHDRKLYVVGAEALAPRPLPPHRLTKKERIYVCTCERKFATSLAAEIHVHDANTRLAS